MTTPVYQPKGAPSPKVMITTAIIGSLVALALLGFFLPADAPTVAKVGVLCVGTVIFYLFNRLFLNEQLAHIHVEEALLVAHKHHPADTVRTEDGKLEYRDECWSITVKLPGEGTKTIQVSQDTHDQTKDKDEIFLKVLRGYFDENLMRVTA